MSHSGYYDQEAVSAGVRDGHHRQVIGGLWDEIGDLQVSELTLRALKDGITGPDRLGDVVVTDRRVFAEGTTPGFRGMIDLTDPPMTQNELRSAMSELSLANAAPTQDATQARGIARA